MLFQAALVIGMVLQVLPAPVSRSAESGSMPDFDKEFTLFSFELIRLTCRGEVPPAPVASQDVADWRRYVENLTQSASVHYSAGLAHTSPAGPKDGSTIYDSTMSGSSRELLWSPGGDDVFPDNAIVNGRSGELSWTGLLGRQIHVDGFPFGDSYSDGREYQTSVNEGTRIVLAIRGADEWMRPNERGSLRVYESARIAIFESRDDETGRAVSRMRRIDQDAGRVQWVAVTTGKNRTDAFVSYGEAVLMRTPPFPFPAAATEIPAYVQAIAPGSQPTFFDAKSRSGWQYSNVWSPNTSEPVGMSFEATENWPRQVAALCVACVVFCILVSRKRR